MVTVIRGRKARLLGGAVGALVLAIAAGLYLAVTGQVGAGPDATGQWILLVPAGIAVVGLFLLGKAAFQSEYRVVLNRHRGQTRVQLGRPIRDDPEPLYDEDDV